MHCLAHWHRPLGIANRPHAARLSRCAVGAPALVLQAPTARRVRRAAAAAGGQDDAQAKPAAASDASASSADASSSAAPAPAPAPASASGALGSSGSGEQQPAPAAPSAPPAPAKRGWWDSLPQQTQMTVIGVGMVVALLGLPFLQPTFLYDAPKNAARQAGAVEAVQQAVPAKAARHIPVVTPALEALQAFAMPRTLPDGRVESPGVARIYLASMIILAAFYAISAAVQLLVNTLVSALRAAGVLRGPSQTPKPQAE